MEYSKQDKNMNRSKAGDQQQEGNRRSRISSECFKLIMGNDKGEWVRIRELNYMYQHGILIIDEKKLNKYLKQDIPELKFAHQLSDEEMIQEIVGDREITEEDRKMWAAGMALRAEIDNERHGGQN